MDERKYWVAWSRMPKLGGARLLALHHHFGSLASAWHAPARRLAEVSHLGPKLAEEIVAWRPQHDVDAGFEQAAKSPVKVLTWLDEDYPTPLRDIPDPPPALYLLGDLPDWKRSVAIVGARDATPYGRRIAYKLARELAELGAVVVSGVASGIDRAAHEGALAVAGGFTAGVLGNGFQFVYPAANRDLYRMIADRGALLSEFPRDVAAQKSHFPLRNRVISGLCQGVVVVEAARKSGSLITVDHALEQGRQVFAVPGPIDSDKSDGPHDLLRQGARLVTGVEDILEELGWKVESKPAPQVVDPLAQKVLEIIGRQAVHIDELATGLGMRAGEVGSALLMLELQGVVRQLPGMRYERA